MSQNDPFAQGSDRTLMVPSPGARSGAARAAPQSFDLPGGGPLFGEATEPSTGLNPLLAAANPLLSAVPQMRATLHHADPQSLRDTLARDVKEFERRAQGEGIPQPKIVAARYALCTLLDEAAAGTPWGGSGIWARNSLLVMFHNETWGGEKFFQLLAKLAENPSANLDLLQLMYACLALGFEGRYRVMDNGKAQLEAVRERLADIIKRQQGEYERDLAPHWRVATAKRRPLLFIVPVWVTVSVFALLMVGAYIGLDRLLNAASDPVFSGIQGIRVATAAPPPPKPAPRPRLAPFLAKEISQGLVSVRDDEGRSTVTIRGDSLFPPGSASIAPEYDPLIARIGEALNGVPGKVLVTGHTDNVPIRTARFPSNWHLSEERARSVAQQLAAVVPAARLTAEGRADGEPIASNDTPADRARNRRVEITLIPDRPATGK
jgi:type VI secretion system protein ImpK